MRPKHRGYKQSYRIHVPKMWIYHPAAQKNYGQNFKVLILYMIQRGCGLLAMKCIIPTVKLVTLTFVCVQGPGCDGCRVGMVLKQRVLSQRRDEKFRMPGIDFRL